MRVVVQRVSRAKVTVEGRVTGEIGPGLMILLGVGKEDTSQVAAAMAEKTANLRIFEDEQGKMNRSLLDVKGSALVVSQFTLYGDARGQRRPSYIAAGPPELMPCSPRGTPSKSCQEAAQEPGMSTSRCPT